MSNIRIPGVAWAFLIVAAIAFIHENQALLPIDAYYLDLLVIVLIAVLKSINLGTDQLNRALDIIDEIVGRAAATRVRSGGDDRGGEVYGIDSLAKKAPPRPSVPLHWFFG